ncbi:alpha,alpha-trehalose-phosphate synthase (plasmid) [Halostagnicola larsenii XH-48]|uniref:Alpha,alpha-trehalose-phosphate synthase n=1 Tax=Halostagnicola larsenii XH-48 TaxID=797299 RepID=W0JYP9_9EURY|nr:trehalose-6-phosphate synthase [Halostagnicola larsenii]AHG02138.1 alpha,alpha-trehalose-phosphate synthase [Halostagnicola larsenii XH-48]
MRDIEERGQSIGRRNVSTTNRIDSNYQREGQTELSTQSPSLSTVCPESLIVVSNRQPYRHEFDDATDGSSDSDSDSRPAESGHSTEPDRKITVDEPAGGLTAGLDPVLCRSNGTWIAWGDGEADELAVDQNDCVHVPPDDEAYTLRRLWLSDEAVDSYYYGFSNRVLWPLCHGFEHLLDDRPGDLEWYRRVNEQFATAVSEHVSEESVVWLQDYHLGFAPALIRERVPDSVTIAHFWHIPWPSPETFDHCPAGRELLAGLLGNDLLGFHVDRYAELFVECVDTHLPDATVHRPTRTIRYDGNETRVVATPMGVDAPTYATTSREVDSGQWSSICSKYDISQSNAIGLGVDRLDYTKGIPQRLDALETFFERNRPWRGQFTFVQKATPSRTNIPAYQQLGETVRQRVERINDRFGTDEWQPIVYTEDILPQEDLCALYRNADVMVVSPVSDGMNLVAQEYLASNVDESGALVLSNRAGAHEMLGSHAYTIAPDRTDHFADTLERVLTTARGEKRQRISVLRDRVFDADLDSWMRDQFVQMQRLRTGTDSYDDLSNGYQSPV